jgi:hypothetical protein
MSDPILQQVAWEPAGDAWEMTVELPHEAAIDLIGLLGYLAGLCVNQEPLIDTAIGAYPGEGLIGSDSAWALACRCGTLAWALAATTWPAANSGARR